MRYDDVCQKDHVRRTFCTLLYLNLNKAGVCVCDGITHIFTKITNVVNSNSHKMKTQFHNNTQLPPRHTKQD